MENNFFEKFLFWTKEQPETIAIHFKNKNISYGELYHAINNIKAQLIDEGVVGGDNIAVYMTNSLEMVASVLALLFLDCNIVPIYSYEEQERIESILEVNQCSKILCNNISYNGIEKFDCKGILINLQEDSFVNSPVLENTSENPSNISQLIYYRESEQGELSKIDLMDLEKLLSKYIAGLSLDESSVLCMNQRVDLLDTIAVMIAAFTIGAKYVIFEQVDICNPVQLLNKASKEKVTAIWLESAYLKKLQELQGVHPNDLDIQTIVLNDQVETMFQSDWVNSDRVKQKQDIIEKNEVSYEIEGKIYDVLQKNKDVQDIFITATESKEYLIFYVAKEEIDNREIDTIIEGCSYKLFRLHRFYYDDNFGFDVKKNIEIANKIEQSDKGNWIAMTPKEDLIFSLLEIKMRALGMTDFSEFYLQAPLEELALDSINYMQVVVWLEDTFHIMFDDDKIGLDSFENCYEIVRYVEENAVI